MNAARTALNAAVEAARAGEQGSASGGWQMVAEAGQTMLEMVQQVGRVNQAVAWLDELTQQNAAMVEQSSAAANSMNEQAVRLMDAVHVFSVD